MNNSAVIVNYMHEFNLHVKVFLKCRSDNVETLLDRNLSCINASSEPGAIDPESVVTLGFFTNLHQLMSCLSTTSQLFWNALSLLKTTMKLSPEHEQLIKYTNFIPVLTKNLHGSLNLEKKVTLLYTLQEISYGFRLDWEHPFVGKTIPILLELILSPTEQENVVILSLSVLINLCHKNSVVLYRLLRTIPKVTELIDKIRPLGILACKMYLILGEHFCGLQSNDFTHFMELIFNDLDKGVRQCNTALLKQSVEFLKDIKEEKILCGSVIDYPKLKTDIPNLLKNLNQILVDNPSGFQRICHSSVLEFLDVLIDFDPAMRSFFNDIISYSLQLIENKISCLNALTLMEHICRVQGHSIPIGEEMVRVLKKTVLETSKEEQMIHQEIALLKILACLMDNNTAQITALLEVVNEKYFDRIFVKLFKTKVESLDSCMISNEEIALYVHAIFLISLLGRNASKTWFAKMLEMLKMEQVHYILGKAFRSNNADLVNIVISLSTLPEFPHFEVAKLLATFNNATNLNVRSYQPHSTDPSASQIRNLSNELFVNKDIEERLDGLIRHLTESRFNGELNNIETMSVIDLFQNKLNMCDHQIEQQNRHLDAASSESVFLKQKINQLSVEVSKYHKLYFSLQLSRDKLRLENEKHQRDLKTYNETYHNLQITLENQKEKYERRLRVELGECKEQLSILEKKNKITETKNMELREALKDNEEVVRKQIAEIDGKSKELKKSNQEIVELQAHQKNFIKELAERKQTIEQLETEIKDGENMRQTIMTLMNKRAKR